MFPAIYKNSVGINEVANMQFGLFPVWSKTPILNARVENLESSKLWKSRIFKTRCIVIASYFYEWQDAGGPKTVPWLISKKNSDYLMFAAFYANETDKKTNLPVKSFSIITQDANLTMREIHNHGANKFRQPVILDEDKIDLWLNPAITDMAEIMSCIRQYQPNEIETKRLTTIGDDSKNIAPQMMA